MRPEGSGPPEEHCCCQRGWDPRTNEVLHPVNWSGACPKMTAKCPLALGPTPPAALEQGTGHPRPTNRSECIQNLNPHFVLSSAFDDADHTILERARERQHRSPHDEGKKRAREACHHRCPPLLTYVVNLGTRSARSPETSHWSGMTSFPDPLSAAPEPRFTTDRDPHLHEHMPLVISIRRSAPSDNLELNSKTRVVSPFMRASCNSAYRSSNQVLNSAGIEFGTKGT